MKRFLHVLILLIVFTSCHRGTHKQPATDLRYCGRWMTLNPNSEYFSLKNDGTYADLRFSSPPNSHAPQGVSWEVKSGVLYLTYDFSRNYFHFFKVPVRFTLPDTVKLITDSTMVLATMATKKYPSKQVTLIKMKEDGKFTTY